MMRVIAGLFRSRRLKGTPPAGTRPTSDKLRETLFNILGSITEGAVFLDGYAGIGGVGIEAISRGAHAVHFVDGSRKACALIRENLKSLEIESGSRVLETEMARALDIFEKEGTAFDIAFLDPPYERADLYETDLIAFGSRPLVKKDGVLVVEHSKRAELPERAGVLHRARVLAHGDSCLSFYRVQES